MKQNVISLGQRAIQGDYNTVWAAGELRLQDSRIKHLNVAGQLEAVKSFLGRVHCAGALLANEIQFTRLTVTGDSKLRGICKGDTVSIAGSVTADFLECRILCNGSGNRSSKYRQNTNKYWQGVFHADTFENCGDLQMNFEFRAGSIISHAGIRSSNELECENFFSFSDLEAEAVNADRIFLLTRAIVKVGQLTGTTVMIKRDFKADKYYKGVPKKAVYRRQNKPSQIAYIRAIEADHIEVEYTRAELISGDEIIIGDLCIIDRVEYRRSITISDKAVVNEVVKV
jgi:hypothetical protein